MTYFVEGLSKQATGNGEVRRIGQFDELDDAIAAAEQVIERFLVGHAEPAMAPRDLFSIYKNQGEIPFIFRDGDKTLNVSGFNHFKHALERCQNICGTSTTQPSAADGLPTLISDVEFESMQKTRQVVRLHDLDEPGESIIRPSQQPTDGLPESTIEQRFTHVKQQLVAMWPSEACALYIRRLVISDRSARAGFPQDVVDDLMMLYDINNLRLAGQ